MTVERVFLTGTILVVAFEEGGSVTLDTDLYPKLRGQPLEKLMNVRVVGSREGLHWPDLDEDLRI